MTHQVRIGGGSAGLGDGIVAIPQLLRGGELDYLMLDYLSEYFMPQAGRSRQRDPLTGYVPGFPDEIVALAGHELSGKKVKIVTNAGAVNPRACAAAIREAARRSGLDFKIAVVDGGVVGMDPLEGLELMVRLRVWATQERFAYRHCWSVGDAVLWDNTGTLHRVTRYDPLCGRSMRRTKFAGDEPFA